MIRQRCMREPHQVVAQFVADTREKLGAEPGDAWQLHHLSKQIGRGKMKGLHCCHYHVARAVALILDGKAMEGAAYLCQLLRALHQVALDHGNWSTGSLLLPFKDPVYMEQFGATERELEAVVGYKEAMKKITTKAT